MAYYDASIRVNTRVDTDQLKEAQKEFDRLNKKLDSLYAKGEKLESLGVDKQSRQWQSLKYDVAQAEGKLYDVMERLRELNNTDVKAGFNGAAESGKKFFNIVQKGVKKSNGLLHTMASRLKGIALSLLVFNWITKGFNAMVAAMKEGFNNLSKYSDDYNASMSALKSSTAELKNQLAAAFEPIANIVIPYLSALIGWLTRAADAMSQFLAALQGKSTYTKAKKQVIDYAKSLDTATASAKRALASFDELNVLNKKDGGVVSGGGEITGSDAFETGQVTTRISDFASKVLEAIRPFREAIENWWKDVDFGPLLESFGRLKDACEPFAGYLYDGLLWFLENILLPLGSWTIEDALPAFFDLLSAALEVLSVIIDALKPYAIWLWEEFLAPIAEWTGELLINGIKFLTEKLRDFSDWCKADKSHVELMSSVVLGFLAGIMTYYTVKSIVSVIGKIKGAFDGLILILGGGISPIAVCAIAIGALAAAAIYLGKNWSELSKGEKILAGLAAAALVAAVAVAAFHTAWSVGAAAVAILAGLTLLGLSAAVFSRAGSDISKSSGSSGNSFYGSHDFTNSPLPHLADGAVIQGGRPFAAILGDQRVGQTNIEAPLSTMVEAFKIAQAENGGGCEYTFIAQFDSKVIFKETVRQDRLQKKATGHSAFLY